MRALCFLVVALPVVLAGCGLTLDFDPPDDGGLIGFDARPRSDGSTTRCTVDGDCDDGDACNGFEVCAQGRCVAGQAPECADSFECTGDACDPSQGCTRTPDDARCADDGLVCTVERCDASAGCQRELRHDLCDDGIFCTVDTCDPSAPDGCRHEPVNERCGSAICDASTGCVGSECTTDAECFRGPCDATVSCVGGACVRTAVDDGTSCDDENPCTANSVCMGGTCRGPERSSCPGRPCVLCNPLGAGCDGSLLAPPTTPCEDGDLCTSGEACSAAGECQPESVRACASPGACLFSMCNPATGLCETHGSSGGCDDGNRCTVGDTCSAGVCVAGTPITCAADGDPCTSDACNPATGACDYRPLPVGTACDDGDLCTLSSQCTSDGCTGVRLVACVDDPSPCVASTCDPTTGGCLSIFVDGAPCARGVCSRGTCVCEAGFEDCEGNGSCECDRSTSFCDPTTRLCQRYRSCTSCAAGEVCCPCTGLCNAPSCLSCCMFCPAPLPTPT